VQGLAQMGAWFGKGISTAGGKFCATILLRYAPLQAS